MRLHGFMSAQGAERGAALVRSKEWAAGAAVAVTARLAPLSAERTGGGSSSTSGAGPFRLVEWVVTPPSRVWRVARARTVGGWRNAVRGANPV